MAIKNIGIGGIKKPLVPQLDAEIAAKKNRVKNVIDLPGSPNLPPKAPVMPPVVTPIVPDSGLAEDGLTPEQRSARGEAELDERNRRKAEALANGEVDGTDTPVVDAIDTEATKNALRDRERQLLIDRFQSNLRGTTAEIDAARAGIDPKFRGLTSGVQTQDTMNRERARKLATGFGPSGSGFLGQSGIAQNVITGGRLGQLDVQRSDELAALDRQQIEAQRVADLGQAEAEAGFDIAGLESQLQSEEAQVEFERSRAELQESREYDDYLRLVDKADATELRDEENRLLQENKLLDAEIKEAQNVQDFAREKELAGQKAWIATQLEGVKQANRIALETERGVQDRLTDEADGGETLGDTPIADSEFVRTDEDVNKLLSDYIKSKKVGNPTQAVIEWLINNDGTYSIDQGNAILEAYGIDPNDLILRTGDNTNPSIGQ